MKKKLCLWHFVSEEYIIQDGKDLAYKQTDKEMRKYNISGEEYQSKWKRLRCEFIRKKKQGQVSNEVYISKCKWFQHINFLATINTNVSNTEVYDGMN